MLHQPALKENSEVFIEFASSSQREDLRFGLFIIRIRERRLDFEGRPVVMGGRALDILTELVRNAGEVVSKRDLCEAAWPNMIVDEGCLRFHIGALRKVLSAHDASDRFLKTVAGRGYCFTAATDEAAREPIVGVLDRSRAPLPSVRRMIGREEAILEVMAGLTAKRFLTLVGPPGIGKTTLAVNAAAGCASAFPGGTVFVDFSASKVCAEVPGCVAEACGLTPGEQMPFDHIVASLSGQPALLILDGCEHVIDSVATMAEGLYRRLPNLAILATSRESLRVEDEQVHRVFPLEYPCEGDRATAERALRFPAVALFVDRLQASQNGYRLSDADAPFVIEICRKLDGIPLALELAAGRVPSYGIRQTAALIGSHLCLMWEGRRTAPPRHQTLSAALDWSYDLLTPEEQQLLQRISLLPTPSTLDEVCSSDDMGMSIAAQTLASLVDKSLVVVADSTSLARYRLLDTTRVYAQQKSKASQTIGETRLN